MGSEWPLRPLGDLCDQERGITYGIVKVGDFVRGGVPVIRGGDIRNGRIVFDGNKRVTEAVSLEFRRTILKGGEILVNLISEPGHTAIVPPQLAGANVSRDVGVIPLGDSVDHRYVDYFLKSATAVHWLTARLQGSVTQKINLGILRELPVPLPPLAEQKRIAEMLGSLDDKIELNRRMSQTLESMARALFKSWFVDFDPVRAKSEGRDPGLPPRMADLFPDSIDDSADGEIPTGWRVCGLDEIADFLNGLAMQRFPANNGRALPVIKIAQLHAGDTAGADQACADIPRDYVVQDGDILFSWSGSLSIELWSGGPGALNQHLFKVTSERYPKWFYYLWTRQHLTDFREIAAGKATTMGHIQRGHLSAAKVVVPPAPVLGAMTHVFHPLLDDLVAIRLQSRKLAEAAAALLPRLVSGDLDFGNRG